MLGLLQGEIPDYRHGAIDVRGREGILGLVEDLRPDLIVHTAAQPSHDRGAAIPFFDFEANEMGTLHLLEAARRSCTESPFIGHTRLLTAITAIYFLFLYADQRALNRADAEVASLVSGLPYGQGVVAPMRDGGSRLNGLERVLDWSCIGRCFDFANAEPAALAFRVQATGPNPVAVADFYEALAMTHDEHTVTADEAPLYSVCPSSVPGRRFELRKVEAGEKTCSFSLPVTPPLERLLW